MIDDNTHDDIVFFCKEPDSYHGFIVRFLFLIADDSTVLTSHPEELSRMTVNAQQLSDLCTGLTLLLLQLL